MNPPPIYPFPLNVIDRWCGYWPSSIWECYGNEIMGWCVFAVIVAVVVWRVRRRR